MNGDIDCISRSQATYFRGSTAGASLVLNKWAAIFFFLVCCLTFYFLFFIALFLQSVSLILKETEKRVVESPVPSRPVSEPYTRVTLESSSWEFKKAEQLFKASMSVVVIKKIDRVQNPFMWENIQS